MSTEQNGKSYQNQMTQENEQEYEYEDEEDTGEAVATDEAIEFAKQNGFLYDILKLYSENDYENGDYDLRLEQTFILNDLSPKSIIEYLDNIQLDDDEAFGIDFGIEIDLDTYNDFVLDADIGKIPTIPGFSLLSKNDIVNNFIIGRLRAVKKTVNDNTVMEAHIEVVEYNGVIANNKNFGYTGLPNQLTNVPFIKRIITTLEPDKWYETNKDLTYDYDEDYDEEDMQGVVIPKGTPVKVIRYDEDEGAGDGINFEVVVFNINGKEVTYPAYFWNDETVSNIFAMIDI